MSFLSLDADGRVMCLDSFAKAPYMAIIKFLSSATPKCSNGLLCKAILGKEMLLIPVSVVRHLLSVGTGSWVCLHLIGPARRRWRRGSGWAG